MAFFYLLVIYILLQFSWWSYLLLELNKEVYNNKIELTDLTQSEVNASALEDQYKKDLKTRQSFIKEFALARQQKNFLLSVTHEFKSPLAAVKLNLQTLQKRNLNKDQQSMIISKAVNETDRINNLIENALLAARIDSKNIDLSYEEFNLSECILSILDNRIVPEKGKHEIIYNLQEDVYMKGDELAISSLVINLLENAEKYSSESSRILLELAQVNNIVELTVSDEGIGIPDSEKGKVFDKFYRVGNEDTRKTKGTGLGLFIVKHIADLHKGEIKIRDNTPRGTIFKVILPVA